MTLVARVASALARRGIPHALIGAGALAEHGVARATADIDLLATDATTLEASTWAELRDAGVRVEVRLGDAADPLRGVVRLSETGERPIDIVVGRAAWQAAILERAQLVQIGDAALRVVEAADLILLKLYAGGPQDAWDVDQLLEHSPSAAAEVDARIIDLPSDCAALWERLRRARSARL